jgi:hypothetical protein
MKKQVRKEREREARKSAVDERGRKGGRGREGGTKGAMVRAREVGRRRRRAAEGRGEDVEQKIPLSDGSTGLASGAKDHLPHPSPPSLCPLPLTLPSSLALRLKWRFFGSDNCTPLKSATKLT